MTSDFSICLTHIFSNGVDFLQNGADFLKNLAAVLQKVNVLFLCGGYLLGPVALVAFPVAPKTAENAPVDVTISGGYDAW